MAASRPAPKGRNFPAGPHRLHREKHRLSGNSASTSADICSPLILEGLACELI